MIMEHGNNNKMYATTILCVRKDGDVVMGADGQVSLGNTVMKSTANKLRSLYNDKILVGFAGSTADALTLFERLQGKLEEHTGQLVRSCVELAKDWRMDKYLRKLEAMLLIANKDNILILTGSGDVLEPEYGVAAIGSGSNYALSAARALIDIPDISAEEIVRKSMNIAADICVFSNHNIKIKIISNENNDS